MYFEKYQNQDKTLENKAVWILMKAEKQEKRINKTDMNLSFCML